MSRATTAEKVACWASIVRYRGWSRCKEQVEHTQQPICAVQHDCPHPASLEEDHARLSPPTRQFDIKTPCHDPRCQRRIGTVHTCIVCITGIYGITGINTDYKLCEAHAIIGPFGFSVPKAVCKEQRPLIGFIAHRPQPQTYCRSFRLRCIRSSPGFNDSDCLLCFAALN